ncbi:MAG: hypothetical protein ABIL44_09565 [candidate division WOR-3 bacterium]
MIGRLITNLPLIIALALSQTLYVKTNDQVRLSPRLLNYQGYLTDTLGIPITNPSLMMRFRIYDAQSMGNIKWAENQNVSVSRGIFNVILGLNTPIPDSVFNGPNRWLEITVGSQTLTPRTRIVSTPYAYTATYADTAIFARNSQPDADWVIVGNDMYSGVSGNVGIGRTNPQYKLDVRGIICGGDSNIVVSDYGAVLSGKKNQSGENWDTTIVVCGGYNNRALLEYSAICGGLNNFSNGDKSFIGGGRDNYSYLNAGTIAGGAYDSVKCPAGSVLGGYSNLAGDETRDTAAAVCAGWNNSTLSKYAFVGGGSTNIARAVGSTIAGGISNEADSSYGTVGGGRDNRVSGWSTVVSGGLNNRVYEHYGVIDGGSSNYIESSAQYGAVLGGGSNSILRLEYDTVATTGATIAGGEQNSVAGNFSFIGGGRHNTIPAWVRSVMCVIIGGYDNHTSGKTEGGPAMDCNTIVGGKNNRAEIWFCTVGGGRGGCVRSFFGGVLSGDSNAVLSGTSEMLDSFVVIAGGRHNTRQSHSVCSYLGGGIDNRIYDDFGVICGGDSNYSHYFNTIGGGYHNSGNVLGGQDNATESYYRSYIGGGYYNKLDYLNVSYGVIPGGRDAQVDNWVNRGFLTNYHTYIYIYHDQSATFTTSHTTAADQVRAASFSTGTVNLAIDHPNDPMNKILNQYVIGADELLSKYSGSVVLNSGGKAVVHLPDYFDNINRNPRVQLTGVGTYEVYVAENVNNNKFVIQGKPGTEVYWKVTAERKDIHAEIARIQTPAVQEKTGKLRGHSIDDDAMIGIYDQIHAKNPQLFQFKTEEGRRVNEELKQQIENGELKIENK